MVEVSIVLFANKVLVLMVLAFSVTTSIVEVAMVEIKVVLTFNVFAVIVLAITS